jgi:branched-chain amino acid transport system substrate-binding protein
MKSQNWFVAVAALFVSLDVTSALAEQGVSSDKIVFGQAAALEGPVAAFGRDVRAGLLAAFNEANAQGGVRGRKLELLSRNDSYEPELSVAATRQLIEEDHVFALTGAVGTSALMAAEPIAEEAGVPIVGPFTGAEFLREASRPNVVNVRASYSEEVEAMVAHLTKDRGVERIGILYQDDSFGRSAFAGLLRALDKRGLKPAGEGMFERNTRAVKTALATIRKANPQAVIMIAPYGPCAEFVKLSRQLHFEPALLATSFTGLDALVGELGPAATGVFATQVVPLPGDMSVPAVARYRAALAALDPKGSPDAVSFEGYLVGRLIVAALQASGPEPTRKSFLDAIYGHDFDFDGVVFNYLDHVNQAAAHVSLAVVGPDGKAKAVTGLRQAVE